MPPDIVPSRRQRPHKHVIGKGHQTACSERKRCELRKQSHRNPTLRYISTPCRHRKEALHAPIISRKGFTVKSEKVCRRPASTRIAVDRSSRFLPIVPRPRLARLCLCGRRAARQNHDCRDGPNPQHSEENDTPQAIYSRDRSVLCRCSGFWEISVRHNVAISCIVTKRCARFLRCA